MKSTQVQGRIQLDKGTNSWRGSLRHGNRPVYPRNSSHPISQRTAGM